MSRVTARESKIRKLQQSKTETFDTFYRQEILYSEMCDDEDQIRVFKRVTNYEDIEAYFEDQLAWDSYEKRLQIGHKPPLKDHSLNNAQKPKRLFKEKADKELKIRLD